MDKIVAECTWSWNVSCLQAQIKAHESVILDLSSGNPPDLENTDDAYLVYIHIIIEVIQWYRATHWSNWATPITLACSKVKFHHAQTSWIGRMTCVATDQCKKKKYESYVILARVRNVRFKSILGKQLPNSSTGYWWIYLMPCIPCKFVLILCIIKS